jgi:hypothetical protein
VSDDDDPVDESAVAIRAKAATGAMSNLSNRSARACGATN